VDLKTFEITYETNYKEVYLVRGGQVFV